MNLLLRSATVLDTNSPHNGKKVDILVENGKITAIQSSLKADKGIKMVESGNLHVSPGWFDMQVSFCDPGYEYKEDLLSGIRAASFGGLTGVAVMPSTKPPVHSKAEVEYIRNKTSAEIVDVYPVGTVSHNREGKDLAEMYDMFLSGAVAFSDDKKPVQDAGLMLRALFYSRHFSGLIMTHCDEQSISADGKINEGVVSTRLGLKGIPSLAEELMTVRNIYLAEFSGARIHIQNVSSARTVDIIRLAKSRGMKISASVNAHHLALDDSMLKDYDTNYKVNPPLRTPEDIEALRKAIVDGTIDAVTSDHRPQDTESKTVEFDHAEFGMTGLETFFALLNTHRGRISLPKLIDKITIAPRKILNIPVPLIGEGEKANLTFFDPDEEWTFAKDHIRSKSGNTPFIGTTFKGKVIGIYNKGKSSFTRI